MKVKNIAFSGFAAMIFAGLCGVADAASVNLASKSYVDTQLESKANLIDLEALETTVGQKATQESLNTVATQVNQNTLDIADLKAAGYLTETDLNNLKTTLQAAIDDKQAKGDYADAAELETLKTTVETLQSGTVDKTVVENLQTTVNTISADYAKKSELTSAEERLQAAIDAIKIPDVSNLVTNTQLTELRTALETEIAKKQAKGDYATADALTAISTELGTLKNNVYTKDVIDQKIADAVAGGEINLDGYATTSALDALTLLVNGNTGEINALKSAGYQTSTDVQGAITTAIANMATDQELANLKTTLETAIDEKQAKGEYLVAADLQTLNDAVTALQSGKADASTVTTIQETISKLGDTYATKSDMTAADTALQNAIDAIEIPSLEGYVKSSDLATVATTGSYNDLEDKPEIPSIEGLATEQALTNLQTTLQAAIDEKQAKGEYLVAADLTELNDAVAALQSGKADASTVTTIQETISKLGDTYATKSDMTAADTALQNAIDAIEIPSLEGYVKSSDLAAVATTGQYADLQGKPEIPSIEGLVTEQALTNLQTTLQAAIDDKQAKGEYLVAADLQTLNDAVAALQSGKADASTVTAIQETISKLGDTYATKSDMTAADTALQNAIDAIEIPSLAEYAKTADVEAALAGKESVSNKVSSATADEIEAMGSAEKQSKYPSIAVAQTIADAAVTKVNEVAGDLSSLQTQVSTNTADIKTINEAGYQTSTQVSEAIDTATATLATKDELNAKQDTLTAGAGITITDNTISASVDTSSFVPNPTATPTSYGEYVLMLSIGEDGKPEGYDWLDTLDLMGDSGFEM